MFSMPLDAVELSEFNDVAHGLAEEVFDVSKCA
jgi:hypothetical protein